MKRLGVCLLFGLGGLGALWSCSVVVRFALSLDGLAPDDSLPPEHARLAEGFRRGEFTRLEDVVPAPYYVYGPEEAAHPPPRARHFLKYHLPEGRTLVVAVDGEVRLVTYWVYRD